ncbi:epoxide hydrolase 4 [Anabrus simplex]|uniref:epoxide hydrolase 4 n=1 Tax=Anabrus simplex TaxID=316456 RepID=UPI0035A35841
MGVLKEVINRAVIMALALFWASAVCLQLAYLTITRPMGPKFWHKKKRDTPPACLTDPALGTHKYIQLSEVKIHYVEKGDPSKPLMLFVHGFPEFWFSWRHQLKEFSKDYWTVALDMRGYGDSEKPSGTEHYQMKHLVNDLKELVEGLGRTKCILVAHDWGGAVGWQFVRTHPEMIEKYIIMDAPHPVGFREFMISNKKQFLMSWYIFFFQVPCLPELFMTMYDMSGFKKMFVNKDSNSKTPVMDEDIEAYKYTFGKPGAYTPPINYYRANMGKPVKESKGNTEERTKLQGLLIAGEKDDFLSIDLLKLAQKSEPNLLVEVVKKANHFVQQDDPETVNKLIRNFLKK